jgi:GTP diphosphokinase / guanosine-3',5'-bis(diphosphate) 3'-diphosphatase
VSGSEAGVELTAPDDAQTHEFEQLLASLREARPKDDLTPVDKAYRFASQYHEGQMRASGEPYMSHPVAVAQILAGMRMDVVSIETGLLHDVVEDTSVTTADIQKNFGDEVARCVDGVTKLSKINFFSAEDRQAESYRKMLLAMVNDIRVIIVKLADRLHNMRTLGSLSPERRERIARRSLVPVSRSRSLRRNFALHRHTAGRQRGIPRAHAPHSGGRTAA